jgi:hypothetical protein
MKYLYFLKRILCINHAIEIASLSFGNVRNDVTQIALLSMTKDTRGFGFDSLPPDSSSIPM